MMCACGVPSSMAYGQCQVMQALKHHRDSVSQLVVNLNWAGMFSYNFLFLAIFHMFLILDMLWP